MARPKKATVDYFPHYANTGKTVKIIQNKYGNNGYAFFYQLLEFLSRSDGHYYYCQNLQDKEFLASETHVEWGFCTQILDSLSQMGIINEKLWENGVIWMQSLVDSVGDAYKKRKVSVPEIPSLSLFLVPETPQAARITGADNPQDGADNPQTKVNETKEEPPLPPQPNSSPKKPKRVKVSVDYDSEIKTALEAFPIDLRTPVQAFVAVVASDNKTQVISQSRELSLLCELSGVSATTTPDIFRYAILEAITRKKGSIGYLKAIIERKACELVDHNNGDESSPAALPKVRFYENKDKTWTRVDPDGTEKKVTLNEMRKQKEKSIGDTNQVSRFISGIAQAMG